MNDDRPTPAAVESQANQFSIVIPILIWALLQLAALGLAAARVQLWARMASPTDSYAVWIVLAVQVGASAILFPWLMRGMNATLFVIALAALCVQLAGMLSGAGGWTIGPALVGVTLWLLALSLWSAALESKAAKLLGIAVATTATIGAACLVYLRMEFTSAEAPNLRVLLPLGLGMALLSAAAASLVTRRR